ncbi:TonB-dependent receptor, partial [candidate division KSB1 bacterium]|nr:TonB-dependent receptor [candidate division KSB1 bacterium]
MKYKDLKIHLGLLLLLCVFCNFVSAATTGKIAGKVIDKESREPMVGANVMIEGTNYGAAADPNGDFFIINIPPGRYNVIVSMIGYSRTKMQNILVSVNSTTNLNFELSMETLEGQEIIVTASPMSFKKDQTSSVRNVSADQIEVLPIQNMQQVVNMQAGVVNGHFRGGRLDEVSYLIDGVQVDESFDGVGSTATIENDVIKDLEVITGTFNAEYGRAMSGIVNAITKDGGEGFHGSFNGSLGNYYTPHTDLFTGLKAGEVARNQDYKFQIEGPVFPKFLSFFVNVRYQNNKNHLNAIRRFKMDDYSNYAADDPAFWFDLHNGDSSYVPLNNSINRSIFGKLSFRPTPGLKLALIYSNNDDDWGGYNHNYKYAPDGKARTYRKNSLYSFQLNHTITPRMFQELKLSLTDYYSGNYLYENPLDPRYIHDIYTGGGGPGFRTGGQDKNHSERYNKEVTIKYDITWQAHKHHSLKIGALGITHEIDNNDYDIQNKYKNESNVYDNYFDLEKNTFVYPNYAPEIFGDSSLYAEEYVVKPNEFAAYFQDKMEFDEMVINMGVRFDYFDPNTTYPSNRRNPANQLSYPDKPEQTSTKLDADTKYQLSPRFGLSYQLSNTALLRFSYGHFFQVPPMYAMYANNSQLVAPTDYQTQSGNPQLNPEKTVKYEVGLWQELMKDMGLEVTLFYQDIYDLLSMRVISTYNQIQYGLYTNKDYGNSKGLEVKYD